MPPVVAFWFRWVGFRRGWVGNTSLRGGCRGERRGEERVLHMGSRVSVFFVGHCLGEGRVGHF